MWRNQTYRSSEDSGLNFGIFVNLCTSQISHFDSQIFSLAFQRIFNRRDVSSRIVPKRQIENVKDRKINKNVVVSHEVWAEL